MQVHEGNVEIESDLRLVILVEGDGCAHGCAGEGDGFGEEEDGHYGDGGDGHYGSEAGCLCFIFSIFVFYTNVLF